MRSHIRALGVLMLFVCLPATAVEMQIEGLQDSLLGAPTINHCTLRKAIINANDDAATYPQCQAGSGLDEIVFNLPGTITFAYPGIMEDAAVTGDLDITSSLTITGHPDGTVIDAASLDRVLHINPAGAPGVVVTLNNLTLTGGSGLGGGGGILVNAATLILNNVTIKSSFADQGDGGAIWTTNGAVLQMNNCTISGNNATFYGAVVVEGPTTITNSTITNNNSSWSNLTGGIRALGAVSLRNTIVAGNHGDTGDLPNLDGTFTSLGYNIIGPLGTRPDNPTIVATTGDQIGISTASINLGPLQNNGGPTPTHALGAGSIAIDKGHSSGSATDQRGLTRPCDNAAIANATGGDGGDVGAFEVQGVCAAAAAPPDAVDDNAVVAEDSGPNVINVLTNDSDPNGDTITITGVTQGSHGSVSFSATNVTYTPAANYNGSDSFTYTIDDGNSGTHTATVSVTVTAVNDVPVATGESYNMNQDTTLNVAAPGVLANDSDIDGDTLHTVLVTDVAHGTLTLNADGSFSYTPAAHFTGVDTFTYQANDGTAGSNTVTVTIHVLDTEPPVITASLTTATLWPPDHSLIDVGLTYSATDNGGSATTTVAVFSDEDDVTSAGGDQSPDAKGALRLRAERDATSDGRFYLIRITSTDASANTSHECLTVVVPKSLSAADVASVSAQASAARAQCTGAGLFVVGDGPVVGPKQ